MDEVEMWMAMNGKTKKLLSNCKYPKRIVLLTTADDLEWKWTDEKTGVEAIASASDMAKADDVFNEIAVRLDVLLNYVDPSLEIETDSLNAQVEEIETIEIKTSADNKLK